MKAIEKIVEWAVALGRLAWQPMTLRQPDAPKGFNKTQEMVRRRRQMDAGILKPGHNFTPYKKENHDA